VIRLVNDVRARCIGRFCSPWRNECCLVDRAQTSDRSFLLIRVNAAAEKSLKSLDAAEFADAKFW
jgi:hypothetical protein